MVEILPMSSKLEDISERELFEVVFSYKATPPDANTKYTIKEFKISEYRPNKGVTVEETKISGEYRDSFSLGADSLKYITKDRIKKSAGSFDDLPDPTTADLYYFNAPTRLQEVYTYKVTLTYIQSVSESSGGSGEGNSGGSNSREGAGETNPPPVVTEHTIEKVYTQTVFGNWDVWAQQLRDYVHRGV